MGWGLPFLMFVTESEIVLEDVLKERTEWRMTAVMMKIPPSVRQFVRGETGIQRELISGQPHTFATIMRQSFPCAVFRAME